MAAVGAVVRRASQVANGVGAAAMMVMMLLICVDVLLRSVFHMPVLGSYTFELIVFLLAVVVFGGMAYAAATNSHIAVDVLARRLSEKGQAAVGVIIYFVSLCIVFLITWHTAVYAWSLRLVGRESEMLKIPVWPFVIAAAVAMGLFFLVLVVHWLNSLASLRERSRRQSLLVLLIGITLAFVLFAVVPWLHPHSLSAISPVIVGIVGISALFLLLLSGMYIGLVMALVGFVGTAYLQGMHTALGLVGQVPFATAAYYSLCVIPLFVLLGEASSIGGLISDFYSASRKWFAAWPGGLAITSIVACAAFAACSGTSAGTAAAIGKMAIPEMKKYKYDNRLASGSVAAGGTLGILIPPSGAFIVYAILTETSVGSLFLAGIFPGLLLAGLFALVIYILCRRNAQLGPPGPRTIFREKVFALKDVWAVLILFLLVIGGIYGGIFTPIEAAAVGSLAAFILALSKKRFAREGLINALLEAGRITAFIFLLMMGAYILNHFLSISRLPTALAELVSGFSITPIYVLLSILLIYLLLGCVGDIFSMMILTLPIFLPILESLGVDLIWFGVLMVLMMEMGFITPPVGINVFILKGIAEDVPLGDIFRGILPFFIMMWVAVGLVIVFPQIALFLPNIMKGG